MTLYELAKEVAKEPDIRRYYGLSGAKILHLYIATFRVFFEELASCPKDAFLNIQGFGIFDLNKTITTAPFLLERYNKNHGTNIDYFETISLRFRCSKKLRLFLRGETPTNRYRIACKRLYVTDEEMKKLYPSHKRKTYKQINRLKKTNRKVDKRSLPIED